MRDATVRCDQAFKGDLGTCFGGDNACVQGCIRDHERCIEEPLSKREGCRIACAADQKVAVQACKSKADMQACQQAAKQKGAECKQQLRRRREPRPPALHPGLQRLPERVRPLIRPVISR